MRHDTAERAGIVVYVRVVEREVKSNARCTENEQIMKHVRIPCSNCVSASLEEL